MISLLKFDLLKFKCFVFWRTHSLTSKCNNWQSQFLLSGAPGDGQWIVPITLCCCSYDTHKSFLLQTKSETHDVKELLGACQVVSGSSWIKVNVDQTGFYRVKYDEELRARLGYAIEKKYLTETDRYGNLDDYLLLIDK